MTDGGRKPSKNLNVVRDLMLEAATGGILYGDPATRPYPETPAALPLKTSAKLDGDRLRVSIRVAAMQSHTWCSDPFRQEGRMMAQKIVARVELPEGFGEPRAVKVVSAAWGETALKTLAPAFAAERDGGKSWLQVKVNWPYAEKAMGDVAVELEVKGATRTK